LSIRKKFFNSIVWIVKDISALKNFKSVADDAIKFQNQYRFNKQKKQQKDAHVITWLGGRTREERIFFDKFNESLEQGKQEREAQRRNEYWAYIKKDSETKSKDKISSDDIENIENITWEEAEDLVGKLFELKGYTVKIGAISKDGKNKRSDDGGIDVEAEKENEKIGIQVKHWEKNVGFDDVTKTWGVAKGSMKMIIISTKSGFTKRALEFAQKKSKLQLWNSEKFKKELEEQNSFEV
jgi:hypothetical protein